MSAAALCPVCRWPLTEHDPDAPPCQPAQFAATPGPAGPVSGGVWAFRHAGQGRVLVLDVVRDQAGAEHVVYEYLSGESGVAVLPLARFTGNYTAVPA